MKIKKILFFFLSIIITFSSFQTPILAAIDTYNTRKLDDHLSSEDSKIKTLREREIEKYIDKNTGRLMRENIGFVEKIFLSSDDEVAKKEIEQLYFLGFCKTPHVHLGEEAKEPWAFLQLFFSRLQPH